MSAPDEAPPRLVETAGPAGDCLRRALASSPTTAEVPPFSALRERRERRQRRLQRQLAFGTLLSATALLLVVRVLSREDEALSVRAEVSTALQRERVEPKLEVEPSPELEPKPALPEPAHAIDQPTTEVTRPRIRSASKRRESARPVEAAPVEARSAPAASPASPPGHHGARACAELARAGASEQALACYVELAQGTGISAELALFEQARLEGKALRRPERALATLASYRERFPNGSLRAEVMLAQIDWLLRTGERARALELVNEALASGSLQERRPELERLRATLSSP